MWTPESMFHVGSKLWDVVSPWEQGSPEGQFSVCRISVLADTLMFQGAGVTSLPSLPVVSSYHLGHQGLVLKWCGDPTWL